MVSQMGFGIAGIVFLIIVILNIFKSFNDPTKKQRGASPTMRKHPSAAKSNPERKANPETSTAGNTFSKVKAVGVGMMQGKKPSNEAVSSFAAPAAPVGEIDHSAHLAYIEQSTAADASADLAPSFSRKEIVQGIIMAEVLSRPRSKSPFAPMSYRK